MVTYLHTCHHPRPLDMCIHTNWHYTGNSYLHLDSLKVLCILKQTKHTHTANITSTIMLNINFKTCVNYLFNMVTYLHSCHHPKSLERGIHTCWHYIGSLYHHQDSQKVMRILKQKYLEDPISAIHMWQSLYEFIDLNCVKLSLQNGDIPTQLSSSKTIGKGHSHKLAIH